MARRVRLPLRTNRGHHRLRNPSWPLDDLIVEEWKTAPTGAGPVVLQVVRDTTYGQVRHIENLDLKRIERPAWPYDGDMEWSAPQG